jgi:hypothetical protein
LNVNVVMCSVKCIDCPRITSVASTTKRKGRKN